MDYLSFFESLDDGAPPEWWGTIANGAFSSNELYSYANSWGESSSTLPSKTDWLIIQGSNLQAEIFTEAINRTYGISNFNEGDRDYDVQSE